MVPPCRSGGGAHHPHTCCLVTWPAASCTLTSPPPHPPGSHPTPKSLFWPSPLGKPAVFRSYLKKTPQNLPTTKQTKGRSGAQREQLGFPRPFSSRSLDNSFPSSAWLQSCEHPPAHHPVFPAEREPSAYTAAT